MDWSTPATVTPVEVGRLLEAAENAANYPLFAFAIYTGMRPSELVGLGGQDVNLDGAAIHVSLTGSQRIPAATDHEEQLPVATGCRRGDSNPHGVAPNGF